jgi:hypothetical protein
VRDKNSNEIRPPTFVSFKASRPALRPTQSPMKWVLGTLLLKVKRPGREAEHLPPYSAEVKNGETIELYLQSLTRLHGVALT